MVGKQKDKEKENNFELFKREIAGYSVLAAIACRIALLPLWGLQGGVTYGLVLGTAISISNFYLMSFLLALALKRSPAFAVLGYFLRLCFYGMAFYVSVKLSYSAGFAACLGFLTTKCAIYYLHGFRPKRL